VCQTPPPGELGQGLLPPALVPVFSAASIHSHRLCDEYVFRLALRVVAELQLAEPLCEWGTSAEVVARCGLAPHCSLVPLDWLLRHLAARGVLAREDGLSRPRFRAAHVLPALAPTPVLAAQRQHDPACLPSYTLAETVARDYPAFLRGERAGDAILRAPTRLPLWTGYFANANGLYAVNNQVGAVALEAWMPRAPVRILELGGGLASGTAAVLEQLATAGRLGAVQAYRFTELVPAFLRRAQRLLGAWAAQVPALTCAPLDMNRPFAAQGVPPASVSLVYAVNALHVAHDLAFTLGEVHRVLEPGGQLIVAECIRPGAGQTLYPEFLFNVLEPFRAPRLHPHYRPTGGFLTPAQWSAALEAAGFADVRVFPDLTRLLEVFPTFYVATFGATRRA
jgi:SAM-dependent methyltransferase